MADNTDDGHQLSAAIAACELLVRTVNATGGLVQLKKGAALVPAGDNEWLDLAEAAIAADRALSLYYEAGNPPVNDDDVAECLSIHKLEAEAG